MYVYKIQRRKMRRQIKKSFHECFTTNQTESPPGSCQPPKTQSFADAAERENDAVPFSGTEQFQLRNLRSFYRKECEDEMAKIGRAASPQLRSPAGVDAPPRDLIVDKASSSSASPSAAEEAEETAAEGDFIAILTYSRRPREDFRRSMEEMVEARLEQEGEVDREFMEELLFRYLDLNSEKSYGTIVRAFLDLIVVSREDSGRIPARRRPWSGGGLRRKLKLEIKCMRKFGHK